MKRQLSRKVITLLFAVFAVLGARMTTAQQATSGASSSGGISADATPPVANPAARANVALPGASAYPRGAALDPLQEADRAHTESTRGLLAKYQNTTDDEERKQLSAELEKVITEHFEIRQQMRAKELEELNAQIRRLQELHDRRTQEKARIISDRLAQILRDADGLGWGSSDAPNTRSRGSMLGPIRSSTPSGPPR